ncbi:hypothetical protein QUA13_02810 [Microcoleus sp. S28C3]
MVATKQVKIGNWDFEGGRKKEEGRRKKEEGRRKKEEVCLFI